MTKKATAYAVACALLLSLLFLPPLRSAVASSLRFWQQAILIEYNPIFTMPDTSAGNANLVAATGIADRSPATEKDFQKLYVHNNHATNDLCLYWITPAAYCSATTVHDCDGSGTDDGVLVAPGELRDFTVAGDLRTCVVASASTTPYHIERREAP